MAASSIKIADAVAAVLNAAELSPPVTAVRAWLPPAELPDMKSLHVTVAPGARRSTAASRGQLAVDCDITIACMKQIETDADVDALFELVEEIEVLLFGEGLDQADGAVCTGMLTEPLLAAEHLTELQQFTAVLTATYRTYLDAAAGL